MSIYKALTVRIQKVVIDSAFVEVHYFITAPEVVEESPDQFSKNDRILTSGTVKFYYNNSSTASELLRDVHKTTSQLLDEYFNVTNTKLDAVGNLETE